MEEYQDYQEEIEEEFGWLYYQNHPIISFWNIILPILTCSIGILGNAVVCTIKLKSIKKSNVMDLLMITYSMSLILACFWSILMLIEDYYGTTDLWFCHLFHSLTYFPIAVAIPSIFALLIVSKYYTKIELKYGLMLNIAIWIYGFIRGYSSIDHEIRYFNNSSEVSGESVGYCEPMPGEAEQYLQFKLIMLIFDYIIPLFIFFIIVCILNSKSSSSANENIYKFAKINAILYYLGIIPSITTLSDYFEIYSFSYQFSALTYFLNLIVLPVNPFLVYYLDHKFRKEIRKILKRSTEKNNDSNLD